MLSNNIDELLELSERTESRFAISELIRKEYPEYTSPYHVSDSNNVKFQEFINKYPVSSFSEEMDINKVLNLIPEFIEIIHDDSGLSLLDCGLMFGSLFGRVCYALFTNELNDSQKEQAKILMNDNLVIRLLIFRSYDSSDYELIDDYIRYLKIMNSLK